MDKGTELIARVEKLEAEILHIKTKIQAKISKTLDDSHKKIQEITERLGADIVLQVIAALAAPNPDLKVRVEKLEADAEAEIKRKRSALEN